MKRFDWTIWFGLVIGLAAVAAGAWLEGLRIGFLWHPTAALIVFGGTFGAILVRRGAGGLGKTLGAVWKLQFRDETEEIHKIEIARLAWLSRSAHKNGLRVYESYADGCDDTLIAQGLTLLAERAEKEKLEEKLRQQLERENESGIEDAATLESAGGFAPTFGIIGAVLGLIGVLRVLDEPAALGAGIATAFVATVYGIGAANLLFFPLASRLRTRHEIRLKRREEIASVILALCRQETPRAIINQFNLRQ